MNRIIYIPSRITQRPSLISNDPLHQLQRAVRSGSAREQFPVGIIIPDVWTDPIDGRQYEMPFIVVHYCELVIASSGTRASVAILLRQKSSVQSFRYNERDPYDSEYFRSTPHYYLNSGDEYLKGCSGELRDVITPLAMFDRTDSFRTIPVSFFLPYAEELHLNPEDHPMLEEMAWEYFRDTPTKFTEPCAKRVFLDVNGIPHSYRTRTRIQSYPNCTWCVDAKGSGERLTIFDECALPPACAIA